MRLTELELHDNVVTKRRDQKMNDLKPEMKLSKIECVRQMDDLKPEPRVIESKPEQKPSDMKP